MKFKHIFLILFLMNFVTAQTVVVPEDYDLKCDYYCPDPDESSSDYWDISTTNEWCFQNGYSCKPGANFAGCDDKRYGPRGERYWCSVCYCEEVENCDAPAQCADETTLPTCGDVGKSDCNGITTYKDGNRGGNGCPTGCEAGPSCNGICECSNAIEFAYCCEEVIPICGDGTCDLSSEICEFDESGKLCTTLDEGQSPTGDDVDCRLPGNEYECTTCGDGIWQENVEECDYACTELTCGDGGYSENCKNDCSLEKIRRIPLKTCLGEGELYVYQGDQSQNPDISLTVDRDNLLIFTRKGGNFLSDIDVKVNGVDYSHEIVFDERSDFRVVVYSINTTPGDLIEIDAESNYGARAIQGYIAQNKSSPVYDISSMQIIYDDEQSNDMYLTPSNYNYVFFDKYDLKDHGTDDSRKLTVKVDSPSGNIVNEDYTKPNPQGVQGVVVGQYNVIEKGMYSLSVDTHDSVYWPLVDCPVPTYTKIYCVSLTKSGGACIQRWESGSFCDFNSDGYVDITDYTIMTNNFGTTDTVLLGLYDMDGDGDIDVNDVSECETYG